MNMPEKQTYEELEQIVRQQARRIDALEIVILGNKTAGYSHEDLQAVETLIKPFVQSLYRKRFDLAVERQKAWLDLLSRITLGIINQQELEGLIQAVVTGACELIGSGHGFIWILDAATNCMTMRFGTGAAKAFTDYYLKPGEGLAGRVWQSGEALAINDYHAWADRLADAKADTYRSAIAAPIKTGKAVTGVLGLVHIDPHKTFDPDEVVMLQRLADLAALALENSYLYSALEQSRNRYRTLYNHTPVMLHSIDPQGRLLEVNECWLKKMGYTREEVIGRQSVAFMTADTRRLVNEEIRSAFFKTGVVHKVPMQFRAKDGTTIETLCSAGAGLDEQSNVEYSLAVFEDITERLEIEKARQLSEDRLLAAIDAIDEGFVIYDAEDRLAMCNAKYIDIYKESADLLVVGTRFEDIIRAGAKRGQYPESFGSIEEWVAERMAQHRSANSSFEQKLPDGRWLKIAERKMKDGSTVGFRVDITDIKRSEELAQEALTEKEILLREIHHRVKNNLQVVSSLLDLQADETGDPVAQDAFSEAESRVHSMSLVHEILYQSDNLREINFQTYLENLTEHLLHVFTPQAGEVNMTIDAGDVTLGIEQAVPCGLIVTELLTNALKYAFLANTGGAINVSAVYDVDRHIKMIIADNGTGLPSDFDPRHIKSLGVRLVTELIEEQLEGSWTIGKDQGVCWIISWPVP